MSIISKRVAATLAFSSLVLASCGGSDSSDKPSDEPGAMTIDSKLLGRWGTIDSPILLQPSGERIGTMSLSIEFTGNSMAASSLCSFQDGTKIGPVKAVVPAKAEAGTVESLGEASKSESKKTSQVDANCRSTIGKSKLAYSIKDGVLTLTSPAEPGQSLKLKKL